jgi:hypothetical protein
MEEGLKEKTGKSLEEWIRLMKPMNFARHSDIVKYLKSEHGFTHGYANLVALKTRESDAASFDEADLIVSQYAGKEHLKPIYDKIATLVKTFGDDVELVPKKANVSVRAKRQFALIQPSTKTRIDLGLKYDSPPKDDRILDSGSFGTMCTNRIVLTTQEEVDDQVGDWLREAYLQARD